MDTIAADRRSRRRYLLNLPAAYRCAWQGRIVANGTAQVRDISTCGVGLEIDQELPLSGRMEIMIGWPVLSSVGDPITLIAFGSLARQADGVAGVRIRHYEFLTQVEAAMRAAPEDSLAERPPTTVQITELRRNLSRLLQRVESGEVLMVCRQSRAIAEIRPVAKPALPTKASA